MFTAARQGCLGAGRDPRGPLEASCRRLGHPGTVRALLPGKTPHPMKGLQERTGAGSI